MEKSRQQMSGLGGEQLTIRNSECGIIFFQPLEKKFVLV